MSRSLADAQARLVQALRENRVPEGFDAKGIHATAAVLESKQRKHATRHAATARVPAWRQLWRRVRAWLPD